MCGTWITGKEVTGVPLFVTQNSTQLLNLVVRGTTHMYYDELFNGCSVKAQR
jgi:hypothetical protein